MNYIKITYPDINNGAGCRVTLWLSGCTHNCPGCHNSFAKDYTIGQEFDYDVMNEIIDILNKPYIQGLTLSGGDPLDRPKEDFEKLIEFLKTIRYIYGDTKDIWCYTGYYIDELNKYQKNVLKYCDIIVDGPFIISQRDISLPFRGSENQRIINIEQYFNDKKIFNKIIKKINNIYILIKTKFNNLKKYFNNESI